IIGTYLVGIEDYEIKLVLFIPIKAEEKNLVTQAIFERMNIFQSV
ncbi:7774_t:CDS:1, partial [Cetraspora pellucida]